MAEPTVDLYIAARPEPVRALLDEMRLRLGTLLPGVEPRMKWGAPVWDGADGQPAIYLYGGKDHVNVGFVQGATLADPDGLLQARGDKGGHVKLWPGRPVPDGLEALIVQAAGEGRI
ncbi:MAG: DUF1801 domain-containing protein [Rhodobacter sp.]|nr:DUF1801 domain-containing protein [Rhodobacter sp.]